MLCDEQSCRASELVNLTIRAHTDRIRKTAMVRSIFSKRIAPITEEKTLVRNLTRGILYGYCNLLEPIHSQLCDIASGERSGISKNSVVSACYTLKRCIDLLNGAAVSNQSHYIQSARPDDALSVALECPTGECITDKLRTNEMIASIEHVANINLLPGDEPVVFDRVTEAIMIDVPDGDETMEMVMRACGADESVARQYLYQAIHEKLQRDGIVPIKHKSSSAQADSPDWSQSMYKEIFSQIARGAHAPDLSTNGKTHCTEFESYAEMVEWAKKAQPCK